MMKFNKKITLIFLYAICGFIVIFSIAFYFLLFTASGSSLLLRGFTRTVNNKKEVSWQKNEGSLIGGMTYNDIVFENLKWFPVPNKLKIKSLAVDIDSFCLDGITLKIVNARLSLPGTEPIMFYGNFENQLADFNFYTKAITDREIKSLVKAEIFQGITGNFADIDVFVKGSMRELTFSGGLIIEKLVKNDFSLEQSPCIFEINMKNADDKLGLYGPIIFKGGTIKGKKTALVQLQEGKIIFNGDPQNPNFDIKATSVVEKVKMAITLKGNFKEPDLQLNSEPAMSKNRLLLALATNKTWQSTEELLNKGSISLDLAKDFIDYFIFGGQSGKFVEKFGLKGFSVKYDTQGKGVAVTKDLSDKLKGKYEVEEKEQKEGTPGISQKVGGEYKVTENVSLDARKELKQKDADDQQESKTADDQLLLKFKKIF
ncbi:MAG: translocation/assembly module TamB domain-containing protein [Candidatus Omnitrophota bacterium]